MTGREIQIDRRAKLKIRTRTVDVASETESENIVIIILVASTALIVVLGGAAIYRWLRDDKRVSGRPSPSGRSTRRLDNSQGATEDQGYIVGSIPGSVLWTDVTCRGDDGTSRGHHDPASGSHGHSNAPGSHDSGGSSGGHDSSSSHSGGDFGGVH